MVVLWVTLSPFFRVTSCSLENSPVQRPGTRFTIEAVSSLQPFINWRPAELTPWSPFAPHLALRSPPMTARPFFEYSL